MGETYPPLIQQKDNFGSTPLHMAASSCNKKAVSALLRLGGGAQLKEKDVGGFTPLQLGCQNTLFRKAFEETIQRELQIPAPCSTVDMTGKFKEDMIEDDDDDGLSPGGGWRDAAWDGADDRCDFDVRSGSSMSHHELIGRYPRSSRPIVLRNVIPAFIRRAMQKEELMQHYGDMWVRSEEYPAAEHYGGRLYNVAPLESWLQHPNATFASVGVLRRHKLSKLLDWAPHRLMPEGDGYTAYDDSFPVLVIAPPKGVTNHVFRSSHFFSALVHGVQSWAIAPPHVSKMTKDPWQPTLGDDNLLRCTLQSGDVIVVPSLWSSAFKSQGESVSIQRRFVWK